jgi:hypothetical protein
MSFVVIIFILYFNSKQMTIASSIILPLSISNISFAEEIFENEGIIQFDSNVQTERFFLFKVNETTDFIKKLDIDENYFVNIEFIPDISINSTDYPKMLLSKPFLINVLVKFIKDRTSTLWIIKKCSKLFNTRLLFVRTLNTKQIIEINLFLKNIKMTNSNIIIIVVTLTICSTLGVYVAIRKTIQYTRPPVNTLVRSGDIELVDYIEPTQPQQIYNYPDLLEPQFPIYERIINYASDYGRVPSYWSGTPPSYQTIDRLNINSCLENSINPDFILWLIFVLILIIIIIFRK